MKAFLSLVAVLMIFTALSTPSEARHYGEYRGYYYYGRPRYHYYVPPRYRYYYYPPRGYCPHDGYYYRYRAPGYEFRFEHHGM